MDVIVVSKMSGLLALKYPAWSKTCDQRQNSDRCPMVDSEGSRRILLVADTFFLLAFEQMIFLSWENLLRLHNAKFGLDTARVPVTVGCVQEVTTIPPSSISPV